MNLESRIRSWRKSLSKNAALQDGFIEELEVHLRDAIDHHQQKGYDADSAFDLAVKELGSITTIGKQEDIVNQSPKSRFIPGLMRNFLVVGQRQFRKHGLLNLANLFGLTMAFTALLFITLFIHDEMSFEQHHPNAEKIYRVSYTHQGENGVMEPRAFSSGMWLDIIGDRVPAIEEQLRFLAISYGYVENPETSDTFYEEGIYWSDPNFFDFFQFRFKHGRKEDQFNNLNSIVLTESTAIQVFGTDNPIGQNMRYVRRGIAIDFVVTGVIYDPPSNTQIQPKYVAHLQAVQGIYGEGDRGWVDKNPAPGYVFSFVKLNGPEGVPAVASALNSFWEEAIPERAEFMTPLVAKFTDIHFNPPIKWELSTTIDMSYIYGLVVIGAFILIIAMTNFVNLITSQAGKRQKEIGLRKTLGSTRGQLRLQFFTESAGMVLVAMVLAMLLMLMGLPRFNDLIDKNISVATLLEQTALVTGAIGFAIFILLIAGLFPAFYFTRKVRNNFNLNQLLKPQRGSTTGKNILVIVQFAVAITLIIGTLTVFRQLQLINSGKLGENREAILGIRTTRMGNVQQVQRYRNEIEKFSNVASSTLGMHLPRQSDFGRINTKYIAPDKGETAYFWNKFDADGNFTRTFDLELLAGRDFRENVEPNALILNEAAIKELDLSPEEALGLRLEEDSLNYSFGHSDGIVIGVVADFAYKSVKEKIEPLVICANTEVNGALSVRMLTGDKQETIAALGELWGEIYPGRPFEYWFLDEGFERLYNQERRLGKLIPLFSGLAILIALLGLFALTAFISELRRKEIGIRKVLGCSTQGILKMLSWQFFKTILIAVFIGIPLAWYGMEAWLTNFTYRVEVDIAVIGLAVAFVLLLSFLTMSIKSLKAANANPVDSLKYE